MSTSLPKPEQITVGTTRWCVERGGSGPLCLLIHGTGASMHTWDGLAPLLMDHYSVVKLDLPGHAGTQSSKRADLSLQGMASALWDLIEDQQYKPDLIIGHSAGAAIMLQLCLEHPQLSARLCSINGAVIPLQGMAGYLFSPLARLSANSDWMPKLFSFRARNDRNIKKLLDSTGSVVDPVSFRRYAELFSDPQHVSGVLRMMANWRLEKLSPRLKQLAQNIHLIAASNDRTIALRDTYKLQQLLPADKVEVSVINGFGHLVQEESPDDVARLILQSHTPQSKTRQGEH